MDETCQSRLLEVRRLTEQRDQSKSDEGEEHDKTVLERALVCIRRHQAEFLQPSIQRPVSDEEEERQRPFPSRTREG